MTKDDLQRLIREASDEDFEWVNSLNAVLGYPIVELDDLVKVVRVVTAMRQELIVRAEKHPSWVHVEATLRKRAEKAEADLASAQVRVAKLELGLAKIQVEYEGLAAAIARFENEGGS